ncbi:unnamed protein product [Owenia fusiformis]|uniref:Uncharacterized protein n=1 Tax=Owenia fusiformis TaxID=6347 RepID=A0A8J1Y0V2_OWEFU|nr:unnamed protein product [Owenia fusiformis]
MKGVAFLGALFGILVTVAYGLDCEQEGYVCKDKNIETCDGQFDSSLTCGGYWGIQCCKTRNPATTATPSAATTTTRPSGSSPRPTQGPGSTTTPLGSCGKSSVDIRSYITQGRESTPGSWPWQGSLRLSNGATHNCGAVLISDRWVLTAAHCIVSIYDKIHTYRVLLGAHYQYTENLNENAYSARLKFMIPHHRYEKDGPGFPYDIALLELDRPVPLNRYIQPVCLPKPGEVFTEQDECYLTGWGDTRGTGDDNVLNQVRVNVVPNAACSDMWAKYPRTGPRIYDFHICVGDGLKGSCAGDSGGPLVCRRGSQWVLAGVSTWAMQGCDTPNFPSVYSRVTSFLPWIKHNTEGFES